MSALAERISGAFKKSLSEYSMHSRRQPVFVVFVGCCHRRQYMAVNKKIKKNPALARSTGAVQRHVDSKWAATLHFPVLLNPPYTPGGIAPAVSRRCSPMPWGNCLIVSWTDLSLAAPWGKACWHIHIISFVDPGWGPEQSNISFTFPIVVLNLWEGKKNQTTRNIPWADVSVLWKAPDCETKYGSNWC